MKILNVKKKEKKKERKEKKKERKEKKRKREEKEKKRNINQEILLQTSVTLILTQRENYACLILTVCVSTLMHVRKGSCIISPSFMLPTV
jgi:hypothetical protein